MQNHEIAKKLGYYTKVLPVSMRPSSNYESGKSYVGIYSKDHVFIHSAWYSNPDDYEYIIDHLVNIGKLQNWRASILYVAYLKSLVPEIEEMLKNDSAARLPDRGD